MIYIFVLMVSFVLTYSIRFYALKKEIFDIPNERSSHDKPTPRGGGLAIVVAFYLGVLYFYFTGVVEQNLFIALFCSIPLVVIGLLDDIYSLSSKLRFFVQIITVFLALYFLYLDSIVLNIFYFIFMLWLINLYNFLDGIDAYAATNAIFVSFASYIIFGQDILLLVGFASLGFLPFNWQRASIFMGDVGSTFLGFIFGVFIVYFSQELNDFLIWIVLLWLFIFDATYTIIKRLFRGENIFKAHKEHIFQKAVQSGLSHQRIVLYALFINIVFFIFILYARGMIFD